MQLFGLSHVHIDWVPHSTQLDEPFLGLDQLDFDLVEAHPQKLDVELLVDDSSRRHCDRWAQRFGNNRHVAAAKIEIDVRKRPTRSIEVSGQAARASIRNTEAREKIDEYENSVDLIEGEHTTSQELSSLQNRSHDGTLLLVEAGRSTPPVGTCLS